MIETIKAILIAIGFLVVMYMFSLLLIDCVTSIDDWRKNGCKFKCLCKHEYNIELISPFHREDTLLECRKCGKKKRINLGRETIDRLLRGRRYEE
nr:MAG TPA: hydrogenase/urease nickel incorporation protein [Caudoviricetes sp.]